MASDDFKVWFSQYIKSIKKQPTEAQWEAILDKFAVLDKPLNQFPKWKYGPNGSSRTVMDAQQEAALGAGWYDTPTLRSEAERAAKVSPQQVVSPTTPAVPPLPPTPPPAAPETPKEEHDHVAIPQITPSEAKEILEKAGALKEAVSHALKDEEIVEEK